MTQQILTDNEESPQEFNCHYDYFDCDGNNIQMRERYLLNGESEYRMQCLKCGHSVGQAIKKCSIPGNPPLWDTKLEKSFENKLRERRKAKRTQLEVVRTEEFKEKKDWYRQVYLKSPEWRSKARLVMERAKGLCEGCRIKPAHDVHHTTYEHIGNEFLFELVALCRPCHERLHDLQQRKIAQGRRV